MPSVFARILLAIRLLLILATTYTTVNISVAKSAQLQDGDAPNDNIPCLEAVLTGVGGPAPQPGKAQSGVFIRYGTTETNCNSVRLQFDAGRGLLMRLSQIPANAPPKYITPLSLDALFLTHAHTDHTSSLPDLIATRWILAKNDGQFSGTPAPRQYSPLAVICFGITCDTAKRATKMWDKTEIPLRKKNDFRSTRPRADIRRYSTQNDPQIVWSQGDVTVISTSVPHIEDSVGYRVQTPAGDICISGDTGLSENLINLCEGADVLIHEAAHPVLGALVTNPPPNADPKFISVLDNIDNSHTSAKELGAFEGLVPTLIMTHLTPGTGAGGIQGVPLIPYLQKLDPSRQPGPLNMSDYCTALREGGYKGVAHIGVDLLSVKLKNGDTVIETPIKEQTACAS